MKFRRRLFPAAMFLAVEISRAASPNDFFAQGVALNRAGQFPEAAAAFEKSAQAQPAAGTLVDLGITEWQRGHAGAAMRAWERARWIDPFDGRAAQNLKFAREAAQVDEPPLKWFETASTWLAPNAWEWLAGGSLWLAVGALTLPRFFRRRKTGWQQALAAAGLGIFLASLTANLGVVSRTNLGFVLQKNAALLLTPTREGEVISTLNAGEPARQLRTRGNYLLIRTANETGWIERGAFGLVNE
jgi:tetratricopeptide (TPR) repeat protein